MKKSNIICLSVLLASLGATQAQITEFDAMNVVKTDVTGTARYMGMAGAFGALGGDISAIKDNPAGLGVYRSSEVTTTFNFMTRNTDTRWGGTRMDDGTFRFAADNVGVVMSFPTWAGRNGGKGMLRSNWSFSYNRLKNFNRRVRVGADGLGASMTDYMADFSSDRYLPVDLQLIPNEYDPFVDPYLPNQYASWLSVMAYETGLIENILATDEHGNLIKDPNDPTGESYLATDQWKSALLDGETVDSRYMLEESGNISEYALSWGGNISNMVYVGATLNLQTVNYRMRSIYREAFGIGESMHLENSLHTGGVGINGNFGVIVRPVDFLRVGLSYKTPMRYNLTTVNDGFMKSNLQTDNGLTPFHSQPEAGNEYDYEVHVPGEVTAGAAWIIGKRAIVSADFSYTNYRNIKMYDDIDGRSYYDEDNEAIRNTFGHGMKFNVGAEYRVTDHFSVRAGFAAETAAMTSKAVKEPHWDTARTDMEYFRHRGTNYITAGLGYRGNFWYIDAAFVNRNLTEDFVPYNTIDNNPATVRTHNYDVVATVGFRF